MFGNCAWPAQPFFDLCQKRALLGQAIRLTMASSEGAVKRRRVSVKTHGEQGQEDPEAEEAAGLADMVEPAVPAVPLFWSLPADENEPAESTLRHLIPYTRSEAWKWLLGHGKSLLGKSIPKSLEAVQPLKIQEGQGIKETWDLSNMKKALKGHGVYEAAATAWVLSIDAEGDASWKSLVLLGSQARL